MTVQFRKSFVKDLDALDPTYRTRVEKTILELEAAKTLREMRQLKKLQGRSGFFRIRVGDYRLGLVEPRSRSDFGQMFRSQRILPPFSLICPPQPKPIR
jgi:mRNA interferase RelE/StbE